MTRSGGSAASGGAKAVGPRINLTFRRVVQQGDSAPESWHSLFGALFIYTYTTIGRIIPEG